jgi:hypothetical protein
VCATFAAQVLKAKPTSDVDEEESGKDGWGSDDQDSNDSNADEDGSERSSCDDQDDSDGADGKYAAAASATKHKSKGMTCGLCMRGEKDRTFTKGFTCPWIIAIVHSPCENPVPSLLIYYSLSCLKDLR